MNLDYTEDEVFLEDLQELEYLDLNSYFKIMKRLQGGENYKTVHKDLKSTLTKKQEKRNE